MSQPLTLARHTTYLVDDLDASIAAFTSLTGTPFDPIREMPMRMVGDGEDVTEVVRFVYSSDGTIELVAGSSHGVFAPDVPRGLHDMGQMAQPDLDLVVEQQLALGETVEWEVFIGDWRLAAYFAPTPARPLRVKLVNPEVLTRFGPQ